MHPKDVTVVGLAIDIAGALLLARGFITKDLVAIYDESTTYAGGNAFLLKSGLNQKTEAIGGGVLLFLGFLLQMVGNMLALNPSTAAPLPAIVDLALAGVVGLCAFCLSRVVAARTARRRFLEYSFRDYSGAPLFKEAPKDPEDEQKVLARARLYDIKRLPSESVTDLVARLEAFVACVGPKYRGRVQMPGEELAGHGNRRPPSNELQRPRPTQATGPRR